MGSINNLTVTADLTSYRHSKMTQRLVSARKWLCCLFVVYSVPGWQSVTGVTVRPVPAPSGIEAQAKFFQYRHFPTSEDFDQGHRLGSERHFIERHEKSRPAKGLFSAKVRWGDKNGGYGEHYWDLNHAGNTGSHGGDDYHDDDGSYHEDPSDAYNDHSEDSHHYEPESYPSDDVPQYEDSGRAKRAHSRSKVIKEKDDNDNDDYEEPPRRKQRKDTKKEKDDNDNDDYEEPPRRKQRKDTKNKYYRERHEEIHEDEDSEDEEEEITTKSPKIKNYRDDEEVTTRPTKKEDKVKIQREDKKRQSNDRHPEQIKNIKKPEQSSETNGQDERPQVRDKNHFVLVVNHKERQEDTPKQEETKPNRFVNYEGGSGVAGGGGGGVRQHYSSEAVPSASSSRLFIEAQTGHIVDRMTGQAYVLQPLAHSNKYN